MYAKNVTPTELLGVAKAVGVRLEGPQRTARGLRFTLRHNNPWDEIYALNQELYLAVRRTTNLRRLFHLTWLKARSKLPYRIPKSQGVCWHGHRAFMPELFKIAPGARVQSGATRGRVPGGWYTVENFEQTHREVPEWNQKGCSCP